MKKFIQGFILWCKREAIQKLRVVPEEYLEGGYRRLAADESQIEPGKCYSCRHAIGAITWRCDCAAEGCMFKPCYIKAQITEADYEAGLRPVGGWVGLPTMK